MSDTKQQILDELSSLLQDIVLESQEDAKDFLDTIHAALANKFDDHSVKLEVVGDVWGEEHALLHAMQQDEQQVNPMLKISSESIELITRKICEPFIGRICNEDVQREICEQLGAIFPSLAAIDFVGFEKDPVKEFSERVAEDELLEHACKAVGVAREQEEEPEVYEPHMIVRDGLPPLRFKGFYLGQGSLGYPNTDSRGTIVDIYETKSGKYVGVVEQWSRWENETGQTHAASFEDFSSLIDWLQNDESTLTTVTQEAIENAIATRPKLREYFVEDVDSDV